MGRARTWTRPSSRFVGWAPEGSAVFVFVSHLTVPEEDHQILERHFRDRSRLVDDFPGFLYLQLLKPQGGEATHTFVTAWKDRESFRAYMTSKEHAESHSREPAEIMARTRIRHEAYEVLMDSRGVPEWLGAVVSEATIDAGP
jgi:heme oxygenase (mycobilin-producing)